MRESIVICSDAAAQVGLKVKVTQSRSLNKFISKHYLSDAFAPLCLSVSMTLNTRRTLYLQLEREMDVFTLV